MRFSAKHYFIARGWVLKNYVRSAYLGAGLLVEDATMLNEMARRLHEMEVAGHA